jgi:hypothetical protein
MAAPFAASSTRSSRSFIQSSWVYPKDMKKPDLNRPTGWEFDRRYPRTFAWFDQCASKIWQTHATTLVRHGASPNTAWQQGKIRVDSRQSTEWTNLVSLPRSCIGRPRSPASSSA